MILDKEALNEVLEQIGEIAHTEKVPKGQMIIEEDVLSSFYIIRKGSCAVFIYDQMGEQIVLALLQEGACFGEMSNFTDKKTNANIRAEEETELLVIPREKFKTLISGLAPLERVLFNDLCNRLENTNKNLQRKVNQLIDFNNSLKEKIEEQVKDLKEQNIKLEEQNDELQKLGKIRDDFMNMAVHDLRSPLGNVMGYVELLQMNDKVDGDEKLKKITGVIQRQSEGMLNLINDILDISKISSGKMEMNLAAISVREILEECIELNSMLAGGKGIDLKLDCAEELPDCLVDHSRILEVFSNIIGNAVKFSERGKSVTIGAIEGKTSDKLELYVKDEGQGISAEELPKLFKMFEQISTRATEGEKGTGLGLAIVQKLVTLHGGEVWAESEVGEGTTIRFTLKKSQPD